jgi:gluconokinase
MAAGQSLEDADRWPWLKAIGAWIDESETTGLSTVVTCSALKRAYRDALREGRPHLRVFYLLAPIELLSERLSRRHGHFFPPELLASQLRDLEPPQLDEDVVSVPVEGQTPEQIVGRIISEA